ncbi:MAG: DUF5606 domain-containing protein [Opitutaceae bacterium]|nr:DUF5606 domain-containing protein [Cytophagales bacterium]
MELKEVAVVSGKPGLYKIIKPAVNGVILEAMDGSKARLIVGTSTKVSVLGEISVYTESGDNIPLIDVFRIIFAKYGKKLELDPKQSDLALRSFFTELVPEHDKQRVYNSDIKKIITWFNILVVNGFETSFANKEAKPADESKSESEPKKEKKAVKKEVAQVPVVDIKDDKKKESKPDAKSESKSVPSSQKKEVKETIPTVKKSDKAPSKKTGK